MENADAITHKFEVFWGEKKLEPQEDLVRMIMPKAKWWEWRYRREREEMEALCASLGTRLYEN